MANKKEKVELKKLSKRQYEKAVNQKEEEPALMSEYEQDLTWMAYRYAIGRQTIHAHSMACEMAKHIPNRVTVERSRFMAKDIQEEIGRQLRFQSFFFDIDCSLDGTDDYLPLHLLIRFIQEKGITDLQELGKYKRICCWKDKETDKICYEAEVASEEEQKRSFYGMMSLSDLECWNRLALLLDDTKHKWCLCSKFDKKYLIEYFDSYTERYVRVGYDSAEEGKSRPSQRAKIFEPIKIPCKDLSKNAYVVPFIDKSIIVEDNLSDERLYELRKSIKDLEILAL